MQSQGRFRQSGHLGRTNVLVRSRGLRIPCGDPEDILKISEGSCGQAQALAKALRGEALILEKLSGDERPVGGYPFKQVAPEIESFVDRRCPSCLCGQTWAMQ